MKRSESNVEELLIELFQEIDDPLSAAEIREKLAATWPTLTTDQVRFGVWNLVNLGELEFTPDWRVRKAEKAAATHSKV